MENSPLSSGYTEAAVADEQNSRRSLKADTQKKDYGLLDNDCLMLRRWSPNKAGLGLYLLMNTHFFILLPMSYTPISVLLIAAVCFEAR